MKGFNLKQIQAIGIRTRNYVITIYLTRDIAFIFFFYMLLLKSVINLFDVL